MSKGYLVLAQNSDHGDYLRQAYALALSIKNTQREVKAFAVISDIPRAELPDEFLEVFDHYIEIENNLDDGVWKVSNRWRYYDLTPYDETIVLDTDMIFSNDASGWWAVLTELEPGLSFTRHPRTYRNEIITDTYYRKTFVNNDLPNLYSACFYFRKNDYCERYFDMVRHLVEHWDDFCSETLKPPYQDFLSMDLAFALAAKLLGMEDDLGISESLDWYLPTFVHMKSYLQNVARDLVSEDWTLHWDSTLTDTGMVIVGNYVQILPFHYHIKSWLSEDKIAILRKIYDQRQHSK